MANLYVAKRNGMLTLVCADTQEAVYTVPRHVRLPSREPLRRLAAKWNADPGRIGNVSDIMEVENQCIWLRLRERRFRAALKKMHDEIERGEIVIVSGPAW